MKITQPEDLKVSSVIKALFYGQMGVGKTTLALSAPKPLLIDVERGLERVAPQHMCPSLQVNTYEEILELINSDEIDKFETIIIDTLGKMIYLVLDYLAKSNPKYKQTDGSPSQKGWGAIKNQIVNNFYKILERKNKSIIFVAHEKEKQVNDLIVKRPDIAGSTGASLVTNLNLVGYMEARGNQRTIDFTPSEEYYAKNSLGLEGKIELPNANLKGNTFIKEFLLEHRAMHAESQAKELDEYNIFTSQISKEINKLKTLEDFNSYLKVFMSLNHKWDSKFSLGKKIGDNAKSLGFEYNKEEKIYKKLSTKIEEGEF